MLTLTLETTDERLEGLFRVLDGITSDRQEQVGILQGALKWAQLASSPTSLMYPAGPIVEVKHHLSDPV